MPQMKPLMWTMLMTLTLMMIVTMMILNFFTSLKYIKQTKQNKMKLMKWKW